MLYSAADFKTRFPEFTAVEDPTVTTHLEECGTMLSADKYGAKYQQALFLLTAHRLKLIEDDTNGLNVGGNIVASRSIEGGSISFKNTATTTTELYYSKTSYGLAFMVLKKTVRFSGAVLT